MVIERASRGYYQGTRAIKNKQSTIDSSAGARARVPALVLKVQRNDKTLSTRPRFSILPGAAAVQLNELA